MNKEKITQLAEETEKETQKQKEQIEKTCQKNS